MAIDTKLNDTPGRTVQTPCICAGRGCVLCDRTGLRTKTACLRCGGTGSDVRIKDLGEKCRDCKGHGWREIDNVQLDV